MEATDQIPGTPEDQVLAILRQAKHLDVALRHRQVKSGLVTTVRSSVDSFQRTAG